MAWRGERHMDISILPRFLQVELTYKCNSRCAFCYNPDHKGANTEISIKEILEEINSYCLSHVQLIGGEVTTINNLSDYLDILDRTKWKSIVTNGRIYRNDIRGKINEIYISLHGDELTHEELTQEVGSYDKIIDNIKKYVSWGIDVNSDTVLTKFNANHIYDIAKKAKDIGMKRIFVNIFQPEGIGSTRPDYSPSLEQIRSSITQLIKAREYLKFEAYFGTSTPFCLDERLITKNLAFRCGAGEWFGSINPSGEFRICNHSTKSHGNVLKTPLNKIWHSKEIDLDYRNTIVNDESCSDCEIRKHCLGGCRINEKGNYRVDPIVKRDRKLLLSGKKISALYENYNLNELHVSNR